MKQITITLTVKEGEEFGAVDELLGQLNKPANMEHFTNEVRNALAKVMQSYYIFGSARTVYVNEFDLKIEMGDTQEEQL